MNAKEAEALVRALYPHARLDGQYKGGGPPRRIVCQGVMLGGGSTPGMAWIRTARRLYRRPGRPGSRAALWAWASPN